MTTYGVPKTPLPTRIDRTAQVRELPARGYRSLEIPVVLAMLCLGFVARAVHARM